MIEGDLRCGSYMPKDPEALKELTCSDSQPCQIHNNCSGKHAGFLTLNKHLKAGSEYIEIDHPIQRAVKDAFEDVTGESSPGYGIDGCSAPNFATTVTCLARSMAFFAGASGDAPSCGPVSGHADEFVAVIALKIQQRGQIAMVHAQIAFGGYDRLCVQRDTRPRALKHSQIIGAIAHGQNL